MQRISEKTSQKKAIYIIIILSNNIEKVEISHFLHNKVALLTRRRSEWGLRNRHLRIFRKVWAIYISI